MIDRRTFSTMLIAGVATSLVDGSRRAQAESMVSARNVVLVHGAYADGSCWSEVIGRLLRVGLKATAVQNPLTSLADDVAGTRRILALQDGPTVLVGHSWAGTVISEAGVDPKVSALVYVAARAPDAGEDYAALAAKFPTPPANAGLVKSGGFAQLSEEAFLKDFAGGVDPAKARVLYSVQGRIADTLSPRGRPQQRGNSSLRGMPYRSKVEPRLLSWSVSLQTVCMRRRSSWTPVTCL